MSLTVYLADDHAVLREGLRLLLETQGFTVVGQAGDGRTAVRETARLKPEAAILDIAMPELNGIEAARQIREASPHTKVIILSMHSTPAHISRALQAGARGYLLKEAAGAEVVHAVRAVHAGRRYLSQGISDQVLESFLQHGETETQASPLASLSSREREILQLVAEGKTSAEIAALLFISPKTVDTYRSRLMEKLGLKDLAGLIKFAIQQGLTALE
jgi:DNA-binding NarL/FixJ family response regulator